MSPLIKNILSPVHLKTYIDKNKGVEYIVENSHQSAPPDSREFTQQTQQHQGSAGKALVLQVSVFLIHLKIRGRLTAPDSPLLFTPALHPHLSLLTLAFLLTVNTSLKISIGRRYFWGHKFPVHCF